jgi:hypothetical protein
MHQTTRVSPVGARYHAICLALQFAPKNAISAALSITYGNHCPSLEAAGLSELTEKLQPRHPARGT